MKEKILCIIPARGGSKGIPKKNIRLLNGKPLIGWIIEEAQKSRYIDRIIVSTEDNEISETSKGFGVEVVERPHSLAQDNSATMDVIFHTLDVLKKEGYNPDYILLLQCTSPLNTAVYIDEAVEKFLDNKQTADSLISVCKEEDPPWWLKKIDIEGYLTDVFEYDKSQFTRRQDFPEIFRINGAIYISKTEKLYQYKRFETKRTIPYIMDFMSSIDIDTERDFMFAEFLINKMNKDNP